MKRTWNRIIAMLLCVLTFTGFAPDMTRVYAGQNKASNFSTAFTLIGNGANSKILPGTKDTGWNVPTTVTASKRITTYDAYGVAESNHYIDAGDSCYISEIYTNGFVKVQYPISNGKRWAYAKASDFSISKKLPSTKLHVWFSLEPMGNDVSTARLNDLVYLCYRVETTDGKLLSYSTANYTVKETISFPDGSTVKGSYNNNNNWIRSNFKQGGSYKGKVEISGDYTGTVTVSCSVEKLKQALLYSWFSTSKMGSEVSYLEKGKSYYFCYKMTYNGGYFNQYANMNYTVTESVYGPDGKKVYSSTYDKSDNNWIKFTATQTGGYKGETAIKGDFEVSDSTSSVCKDTTAAQKAKLKSISITKNPNKTTYTVGDKLDLSGMVVSATYSDGKKKTVTNYTTSGNTSKAGSITITVSYTEDGVTAKDSFKITVKAKETVAETITVTFDPNGGSITETKKTGEKNTKLLLDKKPVKTVNITFNANGGTGSPGTLTYQQTFKGWIYNTGSESKLYESGSLFLLTKNCTLKASYEDAVIDSLPEVQKEGYSLEGWYTSGGVKAYSGMKFNKNMKLTARWTEQAKDEVSAIDLEEPDNAEEDEIIADDTASDDDIVFDDDTLSDDDSFFDDTVSDEIPSDETDEDEFPILSVGSEIETDQVIYTITKKGTKASVEYTEMFDEDAAEVVIPDKIIVNDVTYRVTAIGAKAFYKNKSVKKVTVGKNITKIKSKAFYGCTKLKKITINSKKLKTESIGKSAFTKMKKNVKIYVPSTKYTAYKKLLKKAGVGSKAKIYKSK